MISGVQEKYLVSVDNNGHLKLDNEQAELLGFIDNEFNWELVRERDKLTKRSKQIVWLEFNDIWEFKDKHTDIALNRSLLMSPFNSCFTWQTTIVTEIVEERDGYVKFKTLNSIYELSRLYDDAAGNPI